MVFNPLRASPEVHCSSYRFFGLGSGIVRISDKNTYFVLLKSLKLLKFCNLESFCNLFLVYIFEICPCSDFVYKILYSTVG
jgi:hypothetical protein